MRYIKVLVDYIATYLWNILIWIDQGANTILWPILNPIFGGGFGNPDETLSSRFGKNVPKNKNAYYMCRFLHLFDKNHCKKSIEEDEA